jgi:polysaccharide export outer membrane protein
MRAYLNRFSGPAGRLPQILREGRKLAVVALATVVLGACAVMPASGPTGGRIRSDAEPGKDHVPFRIVEVTDLASAPGAPPVPAVFQPERYVPPTNLIAPGDVLDISVYESGVTLFGGTKSAGAGAAAAAGGFDPTAQVERLPPVRVDDMGAIRLPYIGRIEVARLTSTELEAKIRAGYKGMSQNPQVMVAIRDSIGNSVILSGEVARPGRLVLPTNTETLSDVLALAGGYRGEAKDLSVRVVRQDQTVELRLSDIMAHGERDMRIYPADRIAIVRAPRSIAVMGAPGRVEQLPFSGPTISLAEALALAGGSNPGAGNAAAVFVFRFEKGEDGSDVPVAYHVNMMRASGYFLSQRFVMRDKDVLYIGNSEANQPSKVVGLVSQLFGPLVVLNSVIKN